MDLLSTENFTRLYRKWRKKPGRTWLSKDSCYPITLLVLEEDPFWQPSSGHWENVQKAASVTGIREDMVSEFIDAFDGAKAFGTPSYAFLMGVGARQLLTTTKGGHHER